jgi:hypothetical protein
VLDSEAPLKPLEELCRAKVISLLVEEKLLPPERVQVLYSWKPSGFSVHAGERVAPEAKADLEDLAQYILRNPLSVEKMTLESPTDTVICRSRLNAKINRNFEVFTPTDFLAAITQHIPDKGAPGPYTYESCDDADPMRIQAAAALALRSRRLSPSPVFASKSPCSRASPTCILA